MDDLADDIALLINTLCNGSAYAVIGVSQGGAATLNFAVRYPTLASCIVACDTQAKTPEANIKAWDDRIALAQKEGMEALANVTSPRWFPNNFHSSDIISMISNTPLLGFETGARALQSYDLLAAGLLDVKTKTLLVAGEKDGALPGALSKLREEWVEKGGDVRFESVNGAGHLPMVDRPEGWLDVVGRFLQEGRVL